MKKQKNSQDKNQNKKIIIASVALVAVVIIGCFSLMFINTLKPVNEENSVTQQTSQQKTYQTISSDELFTLLDNTNISNIVYIGRDTCPHCSVFAPKLVEVINEQDASVYYYDTAAARADDTDKLSDLMNKLDISSVPALIEIKDGIVTSRLDDHDSKEAIADFIRTRQ